ncbi:GNAT family N-acetyltransferase [Fictibacillus halophilus]|uniref:GNAT family N-acetyltransferase n=1 Tax=Fictibacillus halophilus TaxID=1610490 RepID=UPI001CFAEB8F|nr:GNAT family protein [Fictibacillus halophilus]
MNLQIFLDPPALENNRIKLLPLQMEHAKDLFQINSLEVWDFMLRKVKEESDMVENVASKIKLREQMKALPFVVILKDTYEVVGTTSLYEIDVNHKSCELGATWYAPAFQRTFVNSDCKYLLLQYCFEELGLVRVQFKTDERNIRSQKAIERLGAVREGILRNEKILEDGFIRNTVLYSIIKDDWSTVKQGFKDREESYIHS